MHLVKKTLFISLKPICGYPVWVHLYAIVQDLCSQLRFSKLWAQKRRLHAHSLAALLSAQIPARNTQ